MQRVSFLCAVAVSIALARAQMAGPYHPATLAAELRGLQQSLRGGAAAQPALPAAWDVETPAKRYSISTEPLRVLLEKARADQARRAFSLQQAQAWLDLLAQQLEGFAAAEPASTAGARRKLDRILAQSEFSAAGSPPSALELLRQRVARWFQDLLRRIFGALAGNPTASQILFWTVLAGCVGFLAVWLIGWWTRDRSIAGLPRPPRAEAVRTPEDWLAAAQRAAADGDWRQAIHNVYWAAVSRLQHAGALPAGLTHTPREYLRLYARRPALQSPTAQVSSEPLAALTSGLERFWYAGRIARAEDFRESLAHMESLGCKAE